MGGPAPAAARALGRRRTSGRWPIRPSLMLEVLRAFERRADHVLRVVTRQRNALLSLLQQKRRQARAGRAGKNNEPAAGELLAGQLFTDAVVVHAEAAPPRHLRGAHHRVFQAGAEGLQRYTGRAINFESMGQSTFESPMQSRPEGSRRMNQTLKSAGPATPILEFLDVAKSYGRVLPKPAR